MTELAGYILETLREGSVFTLYRGRQPGNPVPILVRAPVAHQHKPADLERLEHEYALADELDPAWAVRPLRFARHEGRRMLVLQDPGGDPLDRQLGRPLELTRFLHVAIALTAALRQAHRRGLVHKDIKPSNLLVDAAGNVRLMGFGIASRLPREHQAPVAPKVIAGTFAYMAPEQTGRMNRSIDARSDLYSLGVTLYEMLTGVLPFTASDPMEWVHCHIARLPMAPTERVPEIPDAIAAIVLKLLAKTAEDRYQTAAGVEADLRQCLTAWQARHRIDSFPLGAHDVSDRLLIREKLYGREAETAALLAAFDRVVADGTSELVLVSGQAGIGKSALVNELHKALVPPRGLFAAGKFDQYRRNIPYVTLAQAFQSLMHQILSKSDAEMNEWRSALLEAVGPNGQLMVNLIPELALIIGEQPPVPDLPPQDRQNRFQLVFRRFLGVFARPEHPLTLFLDDLQWLDTATLGLIEHLVAQPEIRHLLLVGAFRDNEVSSSHPLMRMLSRVRKAGGSFQQISLGPLMPDDVERLIADALRTDRGRARPLADLVFEMTDGNPFFTVQFFTAMVEEGLLAFDPALAAWTWDLASIRTKGFTDNVADLMAAKLGRLPDDTQRALGLLACLGNVTETAVLTLVHGGTEEAVHAALWEAVRAGLVLRADSTYTFLHDRIQEAAYALIAADERALAHLRIGRLLAARTAPGDLEEKIFDIVNQFDRGAALITTEQEREQVAGLNLVAGKRAKAATAYAAALQYFAAGRTLLADNGWDRCYRLMFDLELNWAECEYLTGKLASAQERLATLSIRARTAVDAAGVTCVRLNLYTNLDQSDCAVEVGLDYLRRVDRDPSDSAMGDRDRLHSAMVDRERSRPATDRHPASPHATDGRPEVTEATHDCQWAVSANDDCRWPPQATAESVRRAYERLWQSLGARPIESLLDLPLMTDPDRRATMDVLTALASPALFTDENLFRLVVGRMVSLSLEHGNSDGSCLAYAWLGGVLGTYFGDYQAGFRFGRLGLDLVEKHRLERFSARVYLVFGVHVAHWTQHLLTSRGFLRRAFKAAQDAGDLSYAAYSCIDLITNRFATGDPLNEVEQEAEDGLEFARKVWFGLAGDCITAQLRLIRMLRGLTPDLSSFNDAEFDEAGFEQRLESTPQLAIGACWYWIRKLQARVYAGDYRSAHTAAEKVAALLWTAPTQFELAEFHFYAALARAYHCDNGSYGQRLQQLASHHRQLTLWATNCPETFANRAALVGAEIARLECRDQDAMRLYEEAIGSAHEHGFVQNEGLANELAARFYAARGFATIAEAYLRKALSCYARWGADGKVRQLEQTYPNLRQEPPTPRADTTSVMPVDQLDLATVVKVSEAVSGEIDLGKLIDTLMVIAVRNAGADRGLLILQRGDALQIEAEATTVRENVDVRPRQAGIGPDELPETILRYVVRTRNNLLLDDASEQNPFSGDEYIARNHARSILCLPLVKQARLIGVLYLENNLASHVFTPARIAVLKLLSSQAAIALDNARLYAELINENRDRRKAEDALRASEERWRSLFENVPVGVALISSNGRYVAANPALQKMIGYSEAELRSRTPADITHEDDRAVAVAILAARAAGDRAIHRREKRYRRKDGGVIWIEVSAFLVPVGGDTPLYAAAAMDITDRKRAEEELRRSEASLNEAQRISHTGNWRWNVGTGALVWSAEHFRILGFDPAGPTPTYATYIERVHPDDRAALEQAIARAVGERGNLDHEYRTVLPDGSIRHLQSLGRPDIRDDGNLEFVGTVMDITNRKHADEALRHAQAELARVTRLTTMGELAASLAHEINQPLTAIVTSGNAGLRWLNHARPAVDEARAALSRIVRDGARAGEVIRGLRALVMKSEPQLTRFDINAVIREVLALIHGEFQRYGVQLHTDLPDGGQPVMGDRVQLQQVLLNLIINGIQAMRAVTDRPRELTVSSTLADPGNVLVAVEDTGTGLDPAITQRVFEPFFTTKSDGLGMGLAICRSIIEAHGGHLWASRRTPHGAAFRFTVPAGLEAE